MLEYIILEIWQTINHPVSVTILLIFFMFFVVVLVNGWPHLRSGVNEDAPDMDFENSGFPDPTNEPSVYEDYTFEWKQTGLELGDNGFPSTILGIVTLRRK